MSRTKNTSNTTVIQTLVRVLIGLFVALSFLSVSGATALYIHYHVYIERPVLWQPHQNTRTIEIPANTPWRRVVDILEQSGVIEYRWYFDYWARKHGLADRVRAGTYELEGPMTLSELAEVLERGGLREEVSVTFPEGFTIFHIADRLAEDGLVSRNEFLSAARDEDALKEAGLDAESFEGYLFPDTYRFPLNVTATQVVERMHRRWKDVWDELLDTYQEDFEKLRQGYDFDVHQLVTMASLIERETGASAERDLIARVFYNRLDRKMRLQTDPTCVYGEETYLLVPTPALCRDPESRYSTYVIDGLTPGPIANPGRASLIATLRPSDKPEAMQYLYFVSRRDGTNSHYFSKTYDEHRRAIRRFLKSR